MIKSLLLFVFSFILFFAQAQSDKVQLVNANSLEFDVKATGKVKRLIGDVRFKQRNTLLFCDSAWQYDEENRVEAYGKVHIIHQDSIHFYGDRLTYEGNTRHARLEGNARMTDRNMQLTTPSLDYDLNTGYGYYFNGGKLVSGNNTLTSKNGYFYSASRETFFRYDVVLVNPEYTMYTDTLKYLTGSKVAVFLGPTKIISDKDKLYCRYGEYETDKQFAKFSRKALIVGKENMLFADSIYYERKSAFGRAFRDIELFDTTNKVIVYGDYGEMRGKSGTSYVRGNAVAKQMMESDSMFMFADTIHSISRDSGQGQLVKAFRKVKLVKTDMQAICDSLIYDRLDSSITLFKKPVLWSGANQITADTIKLFIKNGKLDSFVLTNNAYLISRETARHFNQIKGRNMYGYFEDNYIKFLHVNGNGQSIYYPKEDSAFTGANVIDCSEMEFLFKNSRIAHCNFINKPIAVFHPMKDVKPEELKLKGFIWLAEKRPTVTLIMKRFYRKNIFFKKNFRDALIYQ